MENGTQTAQDTGETDVNAAAPAKSRPKILNKRVFYLAAVFAGMLAAKLFFDLALAPGRTPRKPSGISPASGTEALSVPAADPGAAGDDLSALSASSVPPAAGNGEETVDEPASPPLLVLNGIFLSDGEEFAIINNQIVKTGDEIEGAQVKKIRANNVELEFGGKSLYITYEEN